MYEAIRNLSILKEADNSTSDVISKVEKRIDYLQNKKVNLSEMALLRNLQKKPILKQ
jgi:phenylalanine-4-hydroxylase